MGVRQPPKSQANSKMWQIYTEYLILIGNGMASEDAKVQLKGTHGTSIESISRYIRCCKAGQSNNFELSPTLAKTNKLDDNVTIISSKVFDEVDDYTLWKQQASRTERLAINETQNRAIKIQFKEYLPVGIVWMADLHLDDARARLHEAEEDAKIIQKTEGLYLGYGGDGLNWYIKQIEKFPKFDDPVMPKKDETRLFKQWLSWIYLKTLFATAGNHEFYLYGRSGIIFERDEFAKHEIHFSKDNISVEYELGDQTYNAWYSHTFFGKSRINPIGELLRAARHACAPLRPDIIGLAHRHDPAIADVTLDGYRTYLIKSGSYKPNASDYEGQASITESSDKMTVCIMYPDRKECTLIKDIAEGAEYLTFQRNKYKNQN